MIKLLLDENQGHTLANALRAAGVDVVRAADAGLSNVTDAVVLSGAIKLDRVLLTADIDFAPALPLHDAPSVIIVRMPGALPADVVASLIVDAVVNLEADTLRGALVIIEPGRVRLRRAPIAAG